MKSFLVAILLTFSGCSACFDDTFMENPPSWTTPIRVNHLGDFTEPLETAIDLWNYRAGCKIFEIADVDTQVTVLSANGTPCGSFNAPVLGSDVAAAAYLCGSRAEIHVLQPGDTWQQAFILHHELGHILGLVDDRSGAMGPVPRSSTMIRASDRDAKAVKERYCQ